MGNIFGNSRSLTHLEALQLRSLTSDNSATFFSMATTSSGHDGAGPLSDLRPPLSSRPPWSRTRPSLSETHPLARSIVYVKQRSREVQGYVSDESVGAGGSTIGSPRTLVWHQRRQSVHVHLFRSPRIGRTESLEFALRIRCSPPSFFCQGFWRSACAGHLPLSGIPAVPFSRFHTSRFSTFHLHRLIICPLSHFLSLLTAFPLSHFPKCIYL